MEILVIEETGSLDGVSRRRPGARRARFAGWPAVLLSALCWVTLPTAALAQQASEVAGSFGAALLLRQLDGVKRVLLIAAHPDDEDTSLLATLARGWGAQAAYLALTRGEGGQNLIGPELGEGLGILRTGELLAARRLDGALQFFTRAYDFGYSKSAEETFGHWPRDSLLADVVWVIRRFRPQVVVSSFSGTRRDGHGQHQAAGRLALDAFDAAGDPTRFPEQLAHGVEPWSPLKLYRRTFRDPENSTLGIQTGTFDPLLGRSYFQLAMESRSQHRSQDFGVARPPGPRTARIALLESRVSGPGDRLFSGIDTTLAGLAVELPPGAREGVLQDLDAYRDELAAARSGLNALDPSGAVAPLMRAIDRLERLDRRTATLGRPAEDLRRAIDQRIEIAREALLAAASVVWAARVDDDVVTPGQRLSVTIELWNGGAFELGVGDLELKVPDDWSERPHVTGGGEPLPPGELRRWEIPLMVPPDAEPTEPYYLRGERDGDLYRWPDDPELAAMPDAPPPLRATLDLEIRLSPALADRNADGSDAPVERLGLSVTRPIRYRGVDKASGEFWRPVHVVPALSLAVQPEVLVWPASRETPRSVTVVARNYGRDPLSGRLSLVLPRGWRATPEEHAFTLEQEDATASLEFTLRPPASGADGARREIVGRAVARGSDGRIWDQSVMMIDYPHIEPKPSIRPATVRVVRFPIEVVRRRIGYVMGSGDEGPAAIRQLGLELDLLEPKDLERGGFDEYDVIVLGVRAYEVRPDLAAANDRLLEWVRGGGTLIVQYNKYEFVNDGDFAPYPITLRRPSPRVTDEKAPVTVLDPESPVFTRPNRIDPRDFEGWVQERGLYFPSEWDPRYRAQLETGDPGETPSRGSLLVGEVGRGLYVYTSLSFFRQLPAGVPGAYRLFANLLSLEPTEWRAHAGND